MATNTTQATPSAVHSVQPALKVLRCAIDFSDGATKLYTIGTIPAGAVVVRGEVVVTTVFNWGTNNLIDVGVAGTTNAYATIMSLTTNGVIVFDEMAAQSKSYPSATVDTVIQAQMQCTGTAATTGHGFIIVEYVENLGDNSA